MIKLDLKDRKILWQLDLNARQSYNQIGKKVGLSKSTVAYKIKRFEEEGLIRNYYTFIDGLRLGYIVLRLYITYQYTTEDIEKEIIDYFVANKSAVVVYSLHGIYDFEVVFWIKDINSYYNFWQRAMKKFGDYFQDQLLSFYIRYVTYKYSYLLSDKRDKSHRQNTDTMGGMETVEIDDLDFDILKTIATDARMTSSDIAEKLNTNPNIVNYRIKKLIKSDVIKAFRTNIEFSRLGYQYFKVDIYLRDYNQREKIIDYITSDPHLVSIDVTTGISHLELEFHLRNFPQLYQIMSDINRTFSHAIRNYKYFTFQKTHKYVFLPEE